MKTTNPYVRFALLTPSALTTQATLAATVPQGPEPTPTQQPASAYTSRMSYTDGDDEPTSGKGWVEFDLGGEG